MKSATAYKFVLHVVCILLPVLSFADYPVGKHKHIIVPKFSYYSQTDRFDAAGNMVKGLPGIKFNTYLLNIHYGYGITDRLDPVLDLPYLFEVSSQGNGKALTNQGPGDMLFGFNYNLVQFPKSRYLSVQLLSVLPLYTNTNAATTLGLDEYGGEVNLMYFGTLAGKTYFSTEVAYRKYYNDRGPDQLSLSGGIGYSFNRHNQAGFDVSYFQSLSYTGRISLNNTFVNGVYVERNYGYLKPGVSYSHLFSPKLSLAAGTYFVPYGHNTGAAFSSTFSAVFRL